MTSLRVPRSTLSASHELPAAALAYPVPLSESVRRSLLMSVVLLLALMLREIDSLEILSNIRGTLHPILQGDWLMRIIGLAGYVGIGWISYWIWRHRDWLLASLRPPVIEVTASSAGRSSGWTNDRWLAVVWMGVLVALAVQVLWALIVTVGMIAWVGNLAVWSSGAVGWSMLLGLLSACFPLFLVILLVRRELRRVKVTPPSSPPAWFPRFIQFTLVIAIVCSIPLAFGDLSSATLSATQAPAAGVVTVTPISATMTSVGFGGFISVFALALLTRCRIWRAIATAFLTYYWCQRLRGCRRYGRPSQVNSEAGGHIRWVWDS